MTVKIDQKIVGYQVLTEAGAQKQMPTAKKTETAQLCAKCHTKAVVVMDNCMTCLNCGDSKCD